MFRVFFTGAFRKPREINWVIGSVLAAARDHRGLRRLLAPRRPALRHRPPRHGGLRADAPRSSGPTCVFAIFGGPFPGEMIIPRLYSVHILLIPAILIGLFTAHIGLVFVQKHTQFPGPGPHQRERRRLPGHAGLRRQGRWLLLHRLRRHRPDGRAGADQPDLGATGPTTPPRSPPARSPTGTWASPTARCDCCPGWLEFEAFGFTLSAEHLPRAPWCCCPLVYVVLGVYPFVETLGHRRQPRAPPARPAAQRPDPHRHRHGRHHRLLGVLCSPPATTSWRSS